MRIVNVSEAQSSLSALIAQVEQGHQIIISKAGKPVAMLVPYRADARPRTLGGPWSGKVKMATDFDTVPFELTQAFHSKHPP
ncbi:MAG: type II toxin-antitoxin system Phd/YefM family antitoxin [Burkholderiales bacterium]